MYKIEDLEQPPAYGHKLSFPCRDMLVTERFLYLTDTTAKRLSVVSSKLSECRRHDDLVRIVTLKLYTHVRHSILLCTSHFYFLKYFCRTSAQNLWWTPSSLLGKKGLYHFTRYPIQGLFKAAQSQLCLPVAQV